MSRRMAAVIVSICIGLVVGWLAWPEDRPSAAQTAASAPNASPNALHHPSTVPLSREVQPTTVAPSPGPPHPLAPVFPAKAHHTCAAPSELAEGRYTAGEADVLVRDGETVVWSAVNPGAEPARWLGRWLGEVSWADGQCQWTVPSTVSVTFEVLDGGVHTVAGCPVGEAVETDEDGAVSVLVPQGQPCTARVVGGREGLQMGPRVTVSATEATTVELDTALEPLTDDEIDQGIALLQRMGAFHVEQAQAELDRVTRLGAGLPEAQWVIDAARERVAFMEGELARVESPDTEMEALRDFLLSQTN